MRSSVRLRAVRTSTGVRSPRARARRKALQAAAVGQRQVEQDGVEGLEPPQLVRIGERHRDVDAMAALPQAAQHHVAQHRIVFHQKNSHRALRQGQAPVRCAPA